MAIYHLNVRGVAPSRGSSAVASASYQSGQTLVDERTGERCDYARKERVVGCGIEPPDGAPAWAADRQRLWNEATRAHGGGTELVARRWEFALPRELSPEERRQCVMDFCAARTAKGHVCDWAIHDDGDGNPHAHVLETALPLGSDGFERPAAPRSEKCYLCRNERGEERVIPSSEWKTAKGEWAKVFRYEVGGDEVRLTKAEAEARGLTNQDRVSKSPVATMQRVGGGNSLEDAKAELRVARKAWADIANRRLAEHAARTNTEAVTIDHRSFKERGIEYVPTVHEGSRPSPERAAQNVRARSVNAAIDRVAAQLAALKARAAVWFARKTDALTRRRELFIARHRGLMMQTAARAHGLSVAREIARTVGREIDVVFSRRSDNHFAELEAALAKHGIEMDFTDGKGDLSYSKGGQTVTGAEIRRPLSELVAMSREAGRKVSAEELRGMAARETAKLGREGDGAQGKKPERGRTVTVELDIENGITR